VESTSTDNIGTIYGRVKVISGKYYINPGNHTMPIIFAQPASIIDLNTILLIHSDTTDGSAVFTDSSSYSVNQSSTYYATNSTDTAKFGATSIKFPDGGSGPGGNILYNTSGPAPVDLFHFGTGDFTHDFWVYRSGPWSGYNFIAGQENDNKPGACSAIGGTTAMKFGYRRSVSADVWLKTNVVVPLTTWTHIAFVRASGVGYVFVDGVLDGTSFAFTTDLTADGSNIGLGSSLATSNNPRLEDAYMDEIRISNIARWTTNFTPPTAPYAS